MPNLTRTSATVSASDRKGGGLPVPEKESLIVRSTANGRTRSTADPELEKVPADVILCESNLVGDRKNAEQMGNHR